MDHQTFVTMVMTEMNALIKRYGFTIMEPGDCQVVMEANGIMMIVYYDWRRSRECGIELCQLVNGKRAQDIPFSLGEVFSECAVPDAQRKSFCQTSDQFYLRSFLRIASECLVAYCAKLLVNDSAAFTQLGQRRSQEAASYTAKIQLAAVRIRAEEVWREKKYREYVDTLGKFRRWLSDSERKKLDYAERHRDD
jgi:hypothetical protein